MTRTKSGSKGGLVLLATVSLLVAACSGGDDASKDIGTINFYSPEGPDLTEALAAAFMEEVGGTVNVISGGTNVIVNRLIAEQDRPQGDVWYGGGGWMPFEAAFDLGLLEAYTPGPAKDWDLFQGGLQFHHKDWYWTGVDAFVLGLTYDTNKVQVADLPATWAGLAEARWADRLQLPNPAASGTATLFVLSQMLALGEDNARDYFDRVVENANAIPDSGSAPSRAVASGDAEIAVAFEFMAYSLKSRGESVDFHIPSSTPVLANPMALVKNGPNPKGAKLFMDWMLGPTSQKIRASQSYVPLDPTDEVKQLAPLTIEELVPYAMVLDVEWVKENYASARTEWQARYGG